MFPDSKGTQTPWMKTDSHQQPSPDLVQLEVGRWGMERLKEGGVGWDIYGNYKLQKEKEHDWNKRSRTRNALTVVSKLKKKKKESELHCTAQQYRTLDDNINKKCECSTSRQTIDVRAGEGTLQYARSQKIWPYIHPFPGSPWSMCTTKTR